jgi:type I restriction enzyme S subunit
MMNKDKYIPQGYKPSPLGIIPEDWEVKRLGEVCDIDKESLSNKTDPNYEFDYISLSDVDSDCFETTTSKQTFRTAPSRARRIVKQGDVIISTVRPNLQAFTLIKDKVNDLIVSTGFAVLTPKQIISEYLFQYVFSHNVSKQFYQLVVGSNYPAVNSSDVSHLKIAVPSINEQQRIVDVLELWDTAISKQAQLVEKLTLRKRGLMQQLLTGKKRLKGFSGEWKTIELGDALSYIQPTKYLVVSENYNNTYNTPVLTAGKTFILGYTDETTGVFNDLPAIIFDDFTTESKYVTFPFKAKSSAMKILKAHNSNLYFMFCAMQMIKYSIGGHERHWISKFSHLTLKVPSLEEQNAIASVLVQSDKEIEIQKQKMAAMQEQKKGLMQVLLTGKRRI